MTQKISLLKKSVCRKVANLTIVELVTPQNIPRLLLRSRAFHNLVLEFKHVHNPKLLSLDYFVSKNYVRGNH